MLFGLNSYLPWWPARTIRTNLHKHNLWLVSTGLVASGQKCLKVLIDDVQTIIRQSLMEAIHPES